MNEYRLLLVDDEPHVIEDIAMLLEGACDYSLDFYRAYSGQEALRLLDEGRMDLVISDIEMQGMNGLQLLEEIHKRWPDCPVAFLTAHPNFSYAYQAIQNRAANYILKTESDEVLVKKIVRLLDEISQREHLPSEQLSADHASLIQDMPGLTRILSEDSQAQLFPQLQKIGFDPDVHAYCLLVCAVPQQDSQVRSQAILELMRYHIQKRFPHLHGMVGAQEEIVYLVQLSGENERQDMHALFGLLEVCQRCCEATFDRPLSILMQPFDVSACLPKDALKLLMSDQTRIQDTSESILFARSLGDEPPLPLTLNADGDICDVIGNTVEWVCRYITENITGDVSLLKLSTMTGYNARYLSGIFHQRTGQTLSRYVADKRLECVMRFLGDPDIPIQNITRLAGFSSRSYFNRFVKQETGQTPRQIRAALFPAEKTTN